MKLMMGKFFLALTLAVCVSSCTMYTRVEVPRPADLNNLAGIDSVAIINRTGFVKGNKENTAKRILEGVITGEAVGADRNAARKCASGLFDYMSHSLNIKRTVLSDDLFTTANEYRFSTPLVWDTVIALCKEYNVEALCVLEYFDSNNGVSTVTDALNVGILPPPPGSGGNAGKTVIKLGWRIYKPRTREILDEYDFKQGFQRPPSPDAYAHYQTKWNAIERAGYDAGIDYSFRVSDQMILESRLLYRSGSPALKRAGRLAAAGLWDQAAEVWMAETASGKRKVRQRALHNLSVFAERQGNLQLAMEHAQNAFSNKTKGATATQMNNIQRRMDNERIFEERRSK